MEQGIIYIIMGIGWIIAFLLGKYVFPEIKDAVNVAMDLLSKYPMLKEWGIAVCQYIAKYFSDISGEEKNKKAAEIIVQAADQAGIKITEEQARAIAQASYESMKGGVTESEGVREDA